VIRVTVELIAAEKPENSQILGVMDLAIVSAKPDGSAEYATYLKKKAPFDNVFQQAKHKGIVTYTQNGKSAGIKSIDDHDGISALVAGPNRIKGGIFNLVYRALAACGADAKKV